MADNPDEWRRKARACLDTPEGDGVLLALGRLLEAQETERGANSDEAREAARQDALKAGAAVNEALGITALRRCRVLVEIDDLDAGAAVDARTYSERIKRAVRDASAAGRARLCYALARVVADYRDVFGRDLADHMAGALMQMAEGRKNMLAVDRQGVNPDTGAAMMLHMGIVKAAGYEAGVRYGDKRIPDMLWTEAAAIYNAAAEKLRRAGEPCPPAGATTMRDWCTRKRDKNGGANKDRKAFEQARAEGARAASIGLIDPKAKLDALRR